MMRLGRCERKGKNVPHVNILIIRRSKKDPKIISVALQRDFSSADVKCSSLFARRRFLEDDRFGRNCKNSVTDIRLKTNSVHWARNNAQWTADY